MIKIILVGATGAMEEAMAELFSKSSEYEIVAGITAKEEDRDFPIYNSFLKIKKGRCNNRFLFKRSIRSEFGICHRK